MSYIDDVLRIASAELGAKEVGGNNRGPRVEQYQAWTHNGPPDPWCASFVSWVMGQAKVPGIFRTGDTWGIRNWANDHGVYVAVPHAGSVFLLLDENGNPKHTGLVQAVKGDGTFQSIEGNVDGPDGVGGVHSLSRAVDTCWYVDWYPVSLGACKPQVTDGCYKIFWHDGKGSLVDPSGRQAAVKGVKINGKPWAGGDMVIGL